MGAAGIILGKGGRLAMGGLKIDNESGVQDIGFQTTYLDCLMV